MATQQLHLVCDNSTAVNFKEWAKPISDWFRTVGYTNTADTGQLNGAGGGNWTGVSTVPGSAAYYYEIFQPGDTASLPIYYVKVEYGNSSGTNAPGLRISLGTGTDGAGGLTGYATTPLKTATASFTPPSTTTQYECDFHGGDNSRIGAMMWRDGTGNCQQIFGIERSIDASGNPTSEYVSLFVAGISSPVANNVAQTTLYFGVGVVPVFSANSTSTGRGTLAVYMPPQATITSTAFNGSMVFDTAHPLVGMVGRACTIIGAFVAVDAAEGITFDINRFGGTITYIPSKAGPFSAAPGGGIAMRYD